MPRQSDSELPAPIQTGGEHEQSSFEKVKSRFSAVRERLAEAGKKREVSAEERAELILKRKAEVADLKSETDLMRAKRERDQLKHQASQAKVERIQRVTERVGSMFGGPIQDSDIESFYMGKSAAGSDGNILKVGDSVGLYGNIGERRTPTDFNLLHAGEGSSSLYGDMGMSGWNGNVMNVGASSKKVTRGFSKFNQQDINPFASGGSSKRSKSRKR